MQYTSLRHIQSALKSGETSVLGLVKDYLKNIEENVHLNAYVEVFSDEAMENAKTLDIKIKETPDSLGKLFGCIVSIKDLICYKNHYISAGSKILDGFESQFSATAVQAIVNEDAIIIGRTNCDEFGMGSANTNSYFGPVKNGADDTRISGGSSGGAAVSVQTNTCLIALGTDTGGSVRQPASFCGVVGYKPTYGMVSRHGLIAYASSFDQIGIIARQTEDIDCIMSIISVLDDYDSTMFQKALYKDESFKAKQLSDIKIAYIEEAFDNEVLDPLIKNEISNRLDSLQSEGVLVHKIQFPLLEYLVPCYYILTTAEASSNLSRYDGVRYGYRSPNAVTLDDMYVLSRTEGFGQEVKKRIMLGSFVLSEAYYEAYFTKAQQIRQMVIDHLILIFRDYDFIVMPTAPKVAWPLAEKPDDPLEIYMSDIYTVLANLAGIPAISIPLGNNIENMPFGIQLLGAAKEDKKLLWFAKKLNFAEHLI
ncbi:MAG: Asp-tRNA(Asn)/Glu-tRNA(Gln) amidotransferase subunit GatA [Saprospiraceae bacterium]|nr:Asp-tRNA(Asn)/Glu-tRNA(Gln) amidotransferase subunit GatA [Saprospiraceae bacterium]